VNELLTHFLVGVQYLLFPAFAIVALVAAPAALVLRHFAPVAHREGTVLLVGLSFCGYVVGVIAGNSESAVAQTVITGVIGLLAGLVAYVHTKETTKAAGLRTMASIGLVSLLIALLLGLIAGGAYKRRFEPYKQAKDRYNVYFKEFAIPLCLAEKKQALTGKVVETPSTACPTLELGIRPAAQ